ncbi:hypothetical protein I8H84_04130 [Candidatus Saccharibacteria bacterium]|nr:hypothetical protein [Candidatus Saccharibacteria bacterium]MBH1973125.1 hypothetical protein [Candidatus Saccharibacteria bacterium]MBH1990633.1 hypothetical protein [Candidatus Saccharibacteria bacterium]
MNEGSARQQIVESIKANNNILVTVSASPSVDELSAALGLTILLNSLDKRATAVVSGALPPAITFLDPEKTFESSVDSLRDFIIALDKEKADHLRYKVDGDVVKIFITPYRTTLSDKDLEFTQGDYNVELVLALGVKDQDHLDKALSAHGRILHDATVATMSVGTEPSKLGSIDWRDAAASSLCEMLVGVAEALKTDKPVLDEQIATAFLTGIVSATDRFSNDHTSSRVMTMAAQLMAAGANQQLIAAKLEAAHEIGPNSVNATQQTPDTPDVSAGNEAQIDHKETQDKDSTALSIDRHAKKRNKNKQKQTQSEPRKELKPLGEQAQDAPLSDTGEQKKDDNAINQAIAAAVPVDQADEELSRQLAEVVAPVPSSLEDVERELNEAIQAPEEPEAPAQDFVGDTTDVTMPDFEALDVPPSLTPPPQPEEGEAPAIGQSSFISSSHKSGDYINEVAPSSPISQSTQPVVDGIGQDFGGQENATVDPFSMPLAPLTSTAATVSPFSSPLPEGQGDPVAVFQPPVDQSTSMNGPQEMSFEATPPPLPNQADLPPLPPMPDFSTLPPPPPLPVFDQTMPATNMFADQGAQFPAPQGDTPPPAAPTPGQFRIPGQ